MYGSENFYQPLKMIKQNEILSSVGKKFYIEIDISKNKIIKVNKNNR
jgi:hypothetical protein